MYYIHATIELQMYGDKLVHDFTLSAKTKNNNMSPLNSRLGGFTEYCKIVSTSVL